MSIASCVQEESDYFSYELQSKIDKSIICIFLIMYFLIVSVMPDQLYYNLMKVKVKMKIIWALRFILVILEWPGRSDGKQFFKNI